MRILVVCITWPGSSRSGLSLTAAEHVKILFQLGHEISIMGSQPEVLNEELPVVNKVLVASHGSGSMYSPSIVDTKKLNATLVNLNPDIVLLEGWQTSLTHEVLKLSYENSLPVVMFSHGSSVHPFSRKISDILRSLAWWPYKTFMLPSLIKKINLLMTLSLTSDSDRFYDRKLARKLNIPVGHYINIPVNWSENYVPRARRKNQVLIIGYYSHIKNQLLALRVAAEMSSHIHFLFIGSKTGVYYKKCLLLARKLNLLNRVRFCDEIEVDIADEIANSMVIFAPSVTEVLPLTLLEAMACGTPFVATPVGANSDLKGGVFSESEKDHMTAIKEMFENEKIWNELSECGRSHHKSEFTSKNLESQLKFAISNAENLKK
jgi:glycosyltransferase involved in cell wall biosynthesis